MGPAGPHPFIDFRQLKFPQPAHTMRRQAFLLSPAINSVFSHAEMLCNVLGGNPRFGIHGNCARMLSVQSRLKSSVVYQNRPHPVMKVRRAWQEHMGGIR